MNKTHDAQNGNFSSFSSSGGAEIHRLQGASIGRNVQIGQGTVFYYENPNDIIIGNNVSIGQNSKLVFGKLRIEDNVTIGSNVDIRSDLISIGENTAIGNGEAGPITAKIRDCYNDAVHGKIEKYLYWVTLV